MALPIPCQTPGARFWVHVQSERLEVSVEFGRSIPLTEADAERLEANVHNAVELALTSLFERHAS